MLPLLVLSLLLSQQPPVERVPLSTGKFISPIGTHVEVGGFPCNLAKSPDGKYLAVTNVGSQQFVTILRTSDGSVVSQLPFNDPAKGSEPAEGLYYGLAFSSEGGKTILYVSHGAQQTVTAHELDGDGKLGTATRTYDVKSSKREINHQCAGIAVQGGMLFVANNFASAFTGQKGSVSAVSGYEQLEQPVAGAYPFEIVATQSKLYVSCERDGALVVLPVQKTIKVGANPTYLRLNRDRSRLFVSNSNADTISVVDTSSDRVIRTIPLRPTAIRGIPGATPLGMCLSPDEKTLYVALADMNAIAVVGLPEGTLRGYIPTGWYPTDVEVSDDGQRLLVAEAKGVGTLHPNPGKYVLDVIPGTVSTFAVPDDKSLGRYGLEVLSNNRVARKREVDDVAKQLNPGIEHVIYIIKENRTFDQILGDMGRGNCDPSLCLFGRDVTPNAHALAERFVYLDNFYVSGDVSADGWNWSTGGISNEYNQRNTRVNYSGRGRSYDFEGTNNGSPVDLLGIQDASRPSGGYLWDNALKHGVSVRNYGAYVSFGDDRKGPDGKPVAEDNVATKKALLPNTCPNYRRYDLAYPDSDAAAQYGVVAPKQLKTYKGASSRFDAWKKEYDGFARTGKMPRLMILRLPNDHTVGTAAGLFSPRAMVADNDYAVGKVVETVSKSAYWKKTAIFILEDDAQSGYDHVDCHRSVCFVVSPFVYKGGFDDRFYNTDSVLRTIEAILRMPPMNSYDAIAMPLQVFGKEARNDAPFQAILPAKEVVTEINTPAAYRSKDSARLIGRWEEETMPDLVLNEILWRNAKGPKAVLPKVRSNVQARD